MLELLHLPDEWSFLSYSFGGGVQSNALLGYCFT